MWQTFRDDLSPQKSEGTVDNFSNYWAPHFTERRHTIETYDITLLGMWQTFRDDLSP